MTQTHTLAGRPASCRCEGGHLSSCALVPRRGRGPARGVANSGQWAAGLKPSQPSLPSLSAQPGLGFSPEACPHGKREPSPLQEPRRAVGAGRSSGTGPYLPLRSPPGVFRGAVPGGLGRSASFGASLISTKLSRARRPRVGPSICWACPSLSQPDEKTPLISASLSLSREPESPSLCDRILLHTSQGCKSPSFGLFVTHPFFLLFH